jgi:hypothetical protein
MALSHSRNSWTVALGTRTSLSQWLSSTLPSDVHLFAAARRHFGREEAYRAVQISKETSKSVTLHDQKLWDWLVSLLNGLQTGIPKSATINAKTFILSIQEVSLK